MLRTLWAVVRKGRVELLEHAQLPEGARVPVTLLPAEDEQDFWQRVSGQSLADIWENTEDDVYAELLQK